MARRHRNSRPFQADKLGHAARYIGRGGQLRFAETPCPVHLLQAAEAVLGVNRLGRHDIAPRCVFRETRLIADVHRGGIDDVIGHEADTEHSIALDK